MQFGAFEIDSISGGRFRLDGGAMFGIVPKPLWERKAPADEFNRIQLDTNCLLIRNGDQVVLCDTGYGNKLSDKERAHHDCPDFDPDPTRSQLVCNLEQVGVHPDQVTHVLFSHLHFDHAGGATWRDDQGQMQLTFPRAVHVFQKQEGKDATGGIPELHGNYFEDELKFLLDQANCQAVEGVAEIVPGVSVEATGGHTAGHQRIVIRSQNQIGMYLGDLCPTSAHLSYFWTMAYDAIQLDVRRAKLSMLPEIAQSGATLFFDHDPVFQAATIKTKNERSSMIDQVVALRHEPAS